MTNNNDLALKLKAYIEMGGVRTQLKCDIEQLLAERTADKAENASLRQRVAELEKKEAFLKEQLGQLANFNPDWDMLEAARDSLREHVALIAEQDARLVEYASIATENARRIAELEARTVSVKLPDCDYGAVQHMSGGSTDYCNGFVDGTQNAIKRVKAACAAAGIKLEVGE
ncbi:hypothetical protein UYSO10_4249 [Kosakonia radicincitans]|uniref:ead/Ea22-like family protein n=1 Tax=Kosakonia radicincitans TaxID=283686 RepID=UPI0012564B81|nr:ead/Ea22-like family protein [Kosakonia radicincitans]VVT52718.1 hypothetical protein UYSO10_4249 [Kosakonia radicincitans]